MMQKKYLRILFPVLWSLSALCLFNGCEKEAVAPEEKSLVFQLCLPGKVDVTTRLPILDLITIADVWVVQYNAENGERLAAKNFSGEAIGEPTNNGSIIQVTTTDFSLTKSRFYILVNAGTTFLNDFSGDESALKQKTKSISAGATDEPTLLTTGPLTYTPPSSGENAGKVVIVAPLQRAFACVSLQWNTTSAFKGTMTVTGVKAYCLPKNTALYSRGGGTLTDLYPQVADLTDATIATAIGSTGLNKNTPRKFYMGENLRGTGTGTSFAEKNLAGKGPSGSLSGCTKLVFEADYTYPLATAPIKLEYCIYLGGNLMNDYNIQRGNQYNLILNISGANSADVRVTITDGAVVVFDDVETITNNVEF